MPHLLFINANTTGLQTMKRIMDMGYKISYIESPSFKDYKATPETELLKNAIGNVYYLDEINEISKLINLVEGINIKHKIDGLICINEYSMESASLLAEYFGFLFPHPNAVINCRNKELTRNIMNKYGIRNAKFNLILNFEELMATADTIGYPVVIKPKSSGNSFATAIIYNNKELRSTWNSILYSVKNASPKMQEQYMRGFVVEEYLQGKMVSIEIAHDGNKPILLMISGRERTTKNELIEYRIDMPAALTKHEWTSCENYGKSVLKALSLTHGIFHIEVMITQDGPVLIEVNPRLMGSYMPYLYYNLTSNDIFKWLADIALGTAMPSTDYKGYIANKIASAIRFDLAKNCTYCPADFRAIVLKHFAPVYSELLNSKHTISMPAGSTIGRIQAVFANHNELQGKIDNFIKDVTMKLNLELIH
ncbi:argininosuccinate lyase [Candidatus Hepatincola sp. Pdp]